MTAVPVALLRITKWRAEVTGSKSHSKLKANLRGEGGCTTYGLWGALHCTQLPALSAVREPKTASLGHFVPSVCSAKEAFLQVWRSRGEVQVPRTSPTPQCANRARIRLVKGSWAFYVMAHYIHAVSPLSAGKMRQLIHFSSFSSLSA